MQSSFHSLLVALSFFDILYLVMSQMIFGFPGISAWYEEHVYASVLPICFGFAHIGRVGSVYLTLSVTIERYVLHEPGVVFLKLFDPRRKFLLGHYVMLYAPFVNHT